MATNVHPLAPHDLPSFIPAADGSDQMLVVTGVFLLVAVLAIGVLYLNIHSIPERRLHGAGKAQFEIVAVLALLSLLTHNNLFWVAALLLAFVNIPDFGSPLRSMAESLDRLSRRDGLAPGALPAAMSEPAPPDSEDKTPGTSIDGEPTNA